MTIVTLLVGPWVDPIMDVVGLSRAMASVRPLCPLLMTLNLIWVPRPNEAAFVGSVDVRMKMLLLLLAIRNLKFPLMLHYSIPLAGTVNSFWICVVAGYMRRSFIGQLQVCLAVLLFIFELVCECVLGDWSPCVGVIAMAAGSAPMATVTALSSALLAMSLLVSRPSVTSIGAGSVTATVGSTILVSIW